MRGRGWSRVGKWAVFAAVLAMTRGASAQGAPPGEPPPPPVEGEPAPRWPIVIPGFMPLRPFHLGLQVGGGAGWLTPQAAASQGLSEVSPMFHFGVVADVLDLVTTAFTFDGLFPSSNGFSETVVDQNGTVSSASSTANINIAALAAGVRTPDLRIHQWSPKSWAGVFAYVRGGHAWVSGGEGIGDCSDCNATTFQLNGGPFLDAGAHLQLHRGWFGFTFFTGYRQFFGASSVARELQLGLGIWMF